ncbi:MAG: two-component sensor histidine kinase [Bacteroidetes bacterium MedPE-SWsnd-G1]|nr:MAG: two-component sensor histidine kinase [Bacteroidetes bacterium MedPE-SWsnd-G1]
MSKKIFVLIILLMSVSLIGIISVQFYWIKNTIEMSDNQFTSEVKSALRQVSNNISENELDENFRRIGQFALSRKDIKVSELKTFLYEQIDTVRNETFEYAQTILEENYRVPSDFFENDSLDFTKIYSKQEMTIIRNQVSEDGDMNDFMPIEKFKESGELTRIEEAVIKDDIKKLASRIPIHQRIGNNELNLYLRNEFEHRGINTKFKYGVYNDDLATRLKSGYFRKGEDKTYQVPLFVNDDGTSNYQLYVSFPDKKNYLIASIGKVLGLSALFILVIIIVFIGSLYQMIKQKQISEIKTDFINNMTHEFKTPIATINLALDAIKNPKIIDDSEKVLRYSKMIRDENKRMHAQVENVLRISRLEKNQLDLNKVKQNMQELIEEALTHVELLVQSRGGSINVELDATLSEVLADQTHMTNVVVNMLDNAIKYSPDAPIIEITTENTAKNFVLRIKDHGMGMNKNVQKNIFKKFYREERGNVHNVKGHGLGLAYVKRIVEQHQGTVQVESEKGKGSTFILNLPLI